MRIRSHSANSKGPGQVAEAFIMASMPLIPQTEPSAVLHDIITISSTTPPAKKLLNFETATVPPEQVIVHDTAVQTVTNSQNTQETSAMAGGATGTSLQTCQVVRHPNMVKQCIGSFYQGN